MTVRYDPTFLQKLKKINVRIRKSFRQRIAIFAKDPFNAQLNNHPLQKEWKGYRSIDINNDWRAIFTEKIEEEKIVAFFVAIGTHKELYG